MTDTATFIFNLANKYFKENVSSCCETYVSELNVIKIVSGLTVNAELRIVKICCSDNDFKYIFNLDSNKIFTRDHGLCLENYNVFTYSLDSKEFSSEKIKSYLLEIKEILTKLELNKFLGCLVTDQQINQEYLGFDIFDGEYMDTNECCVCLDKTITKTNCEHALCIECWTKLKKDECPMCRCECITIRKTDACNDSDEEDEYHYQSDEESDELDNELDNESEPEDEKSVINLNTDDSDTESIWATESESDD